MQYRKFGNTGVKISALGMGCMRLPMNGQRVDREKAVPLIRRAAELGVNYFDTGKRYCNDDSESTLGEALKGLDRSKIYISTKYAPEADTAADLQEKFETALRKLDTPYIDFYHFWGISWDQFTNHLSVPGGPLSPYLKLKEQGLVKHLSFSFHSDPKDMMKLVDTGYFESVLCQYNLLDRRNEEGIAYAASKGLGVAVMGPVGGGRLRWPSETLSHILGSDKWVSTPELALRFVLSNPNICCALSGMSALEQVEQNAVVASRPRHFTDAEKTQFDQAMEQNKRLAELYCTGCRYCMPCPQAVEIPRVFDLMNTKRVYGLDQVARDGYKQLLAGKHASKGKGGDACVECGECEAKCPQKIKIREQLKECHASLF